MRFNFMHIEVGDLLLVGDSACVVECCCAFADQYGALVRPLVLQERTSSTTSKWRSTSDLCLALLSETPVRQPAAWFTDSEGMTVVLRA